MSDDARAVLAAGAERTVAAEGGAVATWTWGAGPLGVLVHDRGDRSTAWEDGAAVAACWPRATLHTTEGLGHRRLLADAGVVARAVEFLAG